MKKRKSNICNLKSLLLFCMVLGHALERDIAYDSSAAVIYRVIYLFHMPLFVFLSGIGMKTKEACLRQAKQAGKYYLLAQGALLFVRLLAEPETAAIYLVQPYWHLWYLLSLVCWCLFSAFLYHWLSHISPQSAGDWRKCRMVLLAAAIGLLAGSIPFLGRVLSLSRTLVFFPFFLAGVFWGEAVLEWVSQKGWTMFAALPAVIAGYFILSKLPVSFLYQANGYAFYGLNAAAGSLYRVVCYLTAVACSVIVLFLCPKGKSLLTQFGGDTLMTYLFHVFFIRILEFLPYPVQYAVPVSVLCAVFTLYGLSFCFQWSRQIFTYVDSRKRA